MYKFMNKAHADLLLMYGYIRIGTLYDYRKVEHKRGISDNAEGKKSVSHKINKFVVNSHNWTNVQQDRDFLALHKLGNFNIQKGAAVIIHGTEIIREIEHPDCYIFSTSLENTRSVAESLEGVDDCIEILDVNAWAEILTHNLYQYAQVNFEGAHNVKYTKRTELWNGIDMGFRLPL